MIRFVLVLTLFTLKHCACVDSRVTRGGARSILATERQAKKETSYQDFHVKRKRPEGRILVSFAYWEKDKIQAENLNFFAKAAIGVRSGSLQIAFTPRTDFIVVITGKECSPCRNFEHVVSPDDDLTSRWKMNHVVASAFSDRTRRLVVLKRSRNVGMDFGAHNVSLEWARGPARARWQSYGYFFFINSSARGPFFPSYMPPGWHWTDAFVSKIIEPVALVGSSIVCLPSVDEGGPGPRVESWAYALSRHGLGVMLNAGVYEIKTGCKTCPDGPILAGEYALTKEALKAGLSVATLMSRYSNKVDWRDKKHWKCNDNVHASRHGTYDGISMHPFETVFIKASWHVGEPYTSTYTNWKLGHASLEDGTEGVFNEKLYRYATSSEAESERDFHACFRPPI